MVRAEIECGGSASKRDARDTWLRQQVAPVYDAMRANPSRAVSIEKVRASLAAVRK